MKILYLDHIAGVAGDMFTSSFVDAGLVTASEIQMLPKHLGLEGVEIKFNKVLKASVQATHLEVTWTNESWKKKFSHGVHAHKHSKIDLEKRLEFTPAKEPVAHWHTHYTEIDDLLSKSSLDEEVKNFSQKVFYEIALAESASHGVSINEVAFHEVGTIDSILDVVMAAYCISKVRPDQVISSPLRLGRGLIKIAHGTHAVPLPAVSKLSIGMKIGSVPADVKRENVELTTPTGIAIIKCLNVEFREMPEGVVLNQGFGAGTMDLGDYPNTFRVFFIEQQKTAGRPYLQDQVIEAEFNIDDETPEKLAWIQESLFEKGALDVWCIVYHGKKNRTGFLIGVLCEECHFSEILDFIFKASSTLGVRYLKKDRYKLERRFVTETTSYGPLRVKQGLNIKGEVLKSKPEFEDLKKILQKDPTFNWK